MADFINWITSDAFWFPPGFDYEDVKGKEGYPQSRDLLWMPTIGIIILLLRRLFERVVAKKICDKLHMKDVKRIAPQPHPKLETLYNKTKNPEPEVIEKISKQTDISVTEVKRWFRQRRNADKPSLRKKFAESSWRFFFYTAVFCYGMVTLVQTPWFWNNALCWKGYPVQPIWKSIYCYYMLEGGFYISLLFTVMTDVKRKDFTEQMIHHAATLGLIVFSYICNFVRAGSLIMIIHDVSDVFLETAKCCIYAKWHKLADNFFTLFACVFIVSRLMLFPWCILHTTIVIPLGLINLYPGFYVLNGLLLVLQCLNIFWAAIIVRMALRMILQGKVEKDARSEEEESSDN